jgi:phage host-nuclease inhibitor protein Gam
LSDFASSFIARAQREEAVLLYLFGRQLERWAREEVEKLNGKRRSLTLPAGTLAFRKVPPSLQVDDETLVLAWARKNLPACVVITERLNRSILVDHFKTSGEMPDAGVRIDPERDSFSIR